jgi:hypothetical protein
VLQAFWRKLSIGDACAFVSSAAAFQLEELSARAKASEDFDEFERAFLAAKSWGELFDGLCANWEQPPRVVHDALRRVSVRVMDEEELRARVRDRIALHIEGSADNASDVLRGLIDESIHRDLRAQDIWDRLRGRGFHRRELASDAHLGARLRERAEGFVESQRALSVRGREIPRSESDQIMDLLIQGSRVFVTGGAGSGKSTVLAQVTQDALNRGWPVFTLRLDRIGPAETAEALGRELSLPVSPVVALAGVAGGQDSLLVLDQLDAVSLVAGARSNQFDLVAELAAQAARQLGMHIVLSSRQFDVDNDFRLMSLATAEGTQRVEVSMLGLEVVAEVLAHLGFAPESLPEAIRGLLCVPQYLALFAQLAEARAVDPSRLGSPKELYDRFWAMQVSRLGTRLDGESKLLEAIDLLCNEIARRQELFIPLALLDPHSKEAQALASEGLVVVEGSRVGFFHETFFDYAFARRFVGAGRSISELLSPPQDLFRRRQVRQVLAHKRDAEPTQYRLDLGLLVQGDNVRSHLREVAIASLALVSKPTAGEWATLAPLLDDAGDWRFSRAWQVLRTNPAFFDLADAEGYWERWLASEDEKIINAAVWALTAAVEIRGIRVLNLLRPYMDRSPDWTVRLRWFARFAKLGSSREAVELVHVLIRGGGFDETGTGPDNGFWYGTITDLANSRPDWAAEVLGLWLARHVELSLENGHPNPFDPSGGILGKEQAPSEILQKIALAAPAAFVEHLLGSMLQVMDANAGTSTEDQARMDSVWRFRYTSPPLSLDDQLLRAMETALRRLAEVDPATGEPVIRRLRHSDLDTAQFLAARGYLGNPTYFADDAAEWLSRSRTALHLGYSDSPYWASRELIAAVSPACSAGTFRELSEVLLSYETLWERKPSNRSVRGLSQLTLLEALDTTRRTQGVVRRIGELRRKFGRGEAPEPRGIVGGIVGPPISAEASQRMTDEQWLRAMAKHSTDRSELSKAGKFVGGAAQQAQVLQTETTKDPVRFGRLLLRFPDGTAHPYFSAVIRGISEPGKPIPVDLLVPVCLRAAESGGSDAGRWIADLMAQRAHEDMPDELLDLLGSLATEDPDPAKDIWRVTASGGQRYLGGDVDSAALNSTRGEAVMAIGRIVLAKPERLAAFIPVLRRAAQDPIRAVRVATIEALRYVRLVDAAFAYDVFSAAVGDVEEDVLTSRYLERFVHESLRDHFDSVRPTLVRMVGAEEAAASEAGSRQFAVASFFDTKLDAEVDRFLHGSAPQRKGAIEVFADNLAQEARRDRSVEVCIHAFQDEDREVRQVAARCFYALQGVQFGPFSRLFEAFATSKAMVDDAGPALHALSESNSLLPDTALAVCERFAQIHGNAASDISTSAAGDALDVEKIVLRIYMHSEQFHLRSRCLDLLDRMVEIGAYGIERHLDLLDER